MNGRAKGYIKATNIFGDSFITSKFIRKCRLKATFSWFKSNLVSDTLVRYTKKMLNLIVAKKGGKEKERKKKYIYIYVYTSVLFVLCICTYNMFSGLCCYLKSKQV